MTSATPPTLRTGKICYIEIPAVDVRRSASFYEQVFGWTIRQRGDGQTSFDDTVNEVSGAWLPERPPASEPGLLVHVMVADAAAAVEAVVAAGGEIVRPIDPGEREVVATFAILPGTSWACTSSPGWPSPRCRDPPSADEEPTVLGRRT